MLVDSGDIGQKMHDDNTPKPAKVLSFKFIWVGVTSFEDAISTANPGFTEFYFATINIFYRMINSYAQIST